MLTVMGMTVHSVSHRYWFLVCDFIRMREFEKSLKTRGMAGLGSALKEQAEVGDGDAHAIVGAVFVCKSDLLWCGACE